MLLAGCAAAPKAPVKPSELAALENMTITSLEAEISKANEEGTRLAAIREIAIATGIYHGRHWRQEQINSWLATMGDLLATAWNFEQVMLDGLYLPPRVDMIRGHVEEQQDGSVRFIRQAYRIASEPRLVTTAPSYLNYLYQSTDPISPPNPLGLPERGTLEVEVWKAGVEKGWAIGITQANAEFDQDIDLLQRDFGGMLRYLDLVAKGLISPPKLGSREYGVVISADGKSLNVGDEVISIEHISNFQHQSKWEVLGEKP